MLKKMLCTVALVTCHVFAVQAEEVQDKEVQDKDLNATLLACDPSDENCKKSDALFEDEDSAKELLALSDDEKEESNPLENVLACKDCN